MKKKWHTQEMNGGQAKMYWISTHLIVYNLNENIILQNIGKCCDPHIVKNYLFTTPTIIKYNK